MQEETRITAYVLQVVNSVVSEMQFVMVIWQPLQRRPKSSLWYDHYILFVGFLKLQRFGCTKHRSPSGVWISAFRQSYRTATLHNHDKAWLTGFQLSPYSRIGEST